MTYETIRWSYKPPHGVHPIDHYTDLANIVHTTVRKHDADVVNINLTTDPNWAIVLQTNQDFLMSRGLAEPFIGTIVFDDGMKLMIHQSPIHDRRTMTVSWGKENDERFDVYVYDLPDLSQSSQ